MYYVLYIPAHILILQDWVSVASPTQGFPPFCSIVLTVRVRDVSPPPHDLEQLVHAPKSFHSQSMTDTATNKRKSVELVCSYICDVHLNMKLKTSKTFYVYKFFSDICLARTGKRGKGTYKFPHKDLRTFHHRDLNHKTFLTDKGL